MKRKGRKSKTAENSSNGVADRQQDQNGEASDPETEDVDRRRKPNKRKSAGKKPDYHEVDDAEEGSEPDEKRKKSGKNKRASKKVEDEDPQYEVQQVLDEKMIQGVRHYLIRWKGYEPESDTWEPESTLNCSELIAEFKAKKKKRSKLSPNQKRGKKKTKSVGDEQRTWDENQDFEVDRILDVYFKRNGQREFLVSWKGYPHSQNSWEPEENMDCKELIEKFMEKVEKAKTTDMRELRVRRTHTDRLTLFTDRRGRRLSKRNSQKQRVHYYDAE